MAEVAIDAAPTIVHEDLNLLSVHYAPTASTAGVPGDPEPLTPGPDSSKPPDGDGKPPISDPSLPAGGGEPA